MLTILSILLLLPFVGALLVSFFRRRIADTVATFLAAVEMVVAIYAVWKGYGSHFLVKMGQIPWISAKTLSFGIQMDSLSSLLLIPITVIGFLITLYSAGYLSKFNKEHPTQKEKGRYYFLVLLFIGAMTGLVLSPNFFQMFLFWELTTFCSWGLISFTRTNQAVEAGFKALAITHGAGLFFVGALLIMFAGAGSFEFSALAQLNPNMRVLTCIFLFIAAFGKAAQFPLSTWLPSAMAAPTPASAYLHAAAMVKAGIYLIARIAVLSGVVSTKAAFFTAIVAIVTMYIGVTFYFYQEDLKRLLAFSTITHLSYMVLGLSLGMLGSKLAFKGGLLHLINHSFSKSLLFLAVGAISCATGTKNIRLLSGLWRKMPITSAAFIFGALAICGVPPFNIFWSKFYIVAGAIQLGTWWGWLFGILALIESIASFAWFLKVVQKVFFGPVSPAAEAATDPPLTMLIPLLVLMALSILSPVFGLPIINSIFGN
ncbi:MAG TPA: hydrogenase 4 subunit D [Syntrophomonadaceae bacterium]|nr:hydrogenase 4 subunit D [Syntrophomonadaceae bacterium]